MITLAENKTAKKPKAASQDRLSPTAQRIQTAYVDHPAFRRARTEQELFGRDVEVPHVPTWTAFWQLDSDSGPGLAARPPKALAAAEEQMLFLRYNYARYRLAKAVQEAQTHRPGVVLQREIDRWRQRVATAKNQLVQANMALVLAMTKRFPIPHVEFEDLVSEGNMALLRCIEKFDVSRGFKFSTYACRAILKSFHRLSTKVSRYRQHFPANFEPDLEFPDTEGRKHDQEWQDSVDWARQMIARNPMDLSHVEQTIIIERFALISRGKGKTLSQIGQIVGLSAERVRQTLNQALGKMHNVLDNNVLAPHPSAEPVEACA